MADGQTQHLNSLEQRLEEEVEREGRGWMVVTDSMEQRLEKMEQCLDKEVEAREGLKHRKQ